VKDINEVEEIKKLVVVSKEELEFAKTLISHLTKESFSIEEFKDRYTEALKELIKAKLEGKEFKVEEEKSLLEALKASIEVSKKKKSEQ
jgi:DNA end-binding protein Ku